MKNLFRIIFGIGNLFLGAFVAFKSYGWFSPETGLNLPELTYMNILAIVFLLSIFLMRLDTTLKLELIHRDLKEEKRKCRN